jgi:hypothetical protein
MIAVYYCRNATPFTMYVLNVKDADHGAFLDALEANEDYPFPTADVLFIENDEIVDQWNPIVGEQNQDIFA